MTREKKLTTVQIHILAAIAAKAVETDIQTVLDEVGSYGYNAAIDAFKEIWGKKISDDIQDEALVRVEEKILAEMAHTGPETAHQDKMDEEFIAAEMERYQTFLSDHTGTDSDRMFGIVRNYGRFLRSA